MVRNTSPLQLSASVLQGQTEKEGDRKLILRETYAHRVRFGAIHRRLTAMSFQLSLAFSILKLTSMSQSSYGDKRK